MDIIADNEETERYERELNNQIKRWVAGWVIKIAFGIVGFVACLFIFNKLTYKPPEEIPKRSWKGIDPSRPTYEIKSYNFSTREVEYYDFNKPSTREEMDRRAAQAAKKSSKVEIRMNKNQKVILEGMTEEEVLMGFDLDYEGIRDYFGGDELR